MGWIEEHREREIEKQHKKIYFGEVFSKELDKWQRISNKTEGDFAKEVGVHPNMITKWKQGRSFPQAANMTAICAKLGKKESDFLDVSGEYVKNASRKEKSRYLQDYADANGLDEDFYSWLIKRPDFVRVFPFHSIERTNILQNIVHNVPPEEHPEERDFLLVKFEFEDDYGNRKMMVKEDIDFILDIQEETKKHAVSFCLAEKERIREQRIKLQIEKYQRDYRGALDAEEIKKQYDKMNFLHEELETEFDKKLEDKVKEAAEKAGVHPWIRINELAMPVNEEKVAQIFRDQGYNEKEVAELVQQEVEGYKWRYRCLAEGYKNKGYIIEEEENENGQR